MKKRITIILFLLAGLISIGTQKVFADASPGDVIITLGANLTDAQKQSILMEMNTPNDAQTVTVTNDEEHKYLGQYIPASQIGTKSLSCAKITLEQSGTGLSIQTNRISWVTKDMYANALITAGVKDANIYITAPFNVSGTAALTGIMKAYETATGTQIPEAQKQVANEEMVKTADLGNSIGKDKANTLMTNIKQQIAKQKPETEQQVRDIVKTQADALGIQLTDDELNGLVQLFNKMKDLNINWNQVGDQLNIAKEKFNNFIQSDEGQSIIQKAKEFFTQIVDIIKSWFN